MSNDSEAIDLYDKSQLYKYSVITGVRFMGFKTINGRKHVEMEDKNGNRKLVYKELYDKYAKPINTDTNG